MVLEEAKRIYINVLEELRSETPEESINSLNERFQDANDIHKIENNYIYVIVKNSLYKLLIEKFNSRRMDEILSNKIGTKMGFKFITEEDAKKEKETTTEKLATPDLNSDRSNRKLRAEFTFDNFVVGESNRFAFLSAMKVAETPYSILNPLYIFGDVGLGKTHLMMAIGHYVLDKNINAKVVYTSAQQFAEDYFVYTKKDTKNIEFFYNKYRSADVLLVDDIQLLESKPATQEEFFKVFDYLHENNKQIVITSDRRASELKIMPRLVSRFNWGIPVDIKTPDETLRMSILKRKLETLISNPSDVPEECLQIIANNFTSNVRDLEGALRRFITYCISVNIPFTEENVYFTLEGLLPNAKNSKTNHDDETVKKLLDVVSEYFKISKSDLLSNSRKPNVVYARNICFYIIRNDLNMSLKRIGDVFGGKDHTTVNYGCEKIKEMINNSATKNDVQYIKNTLEN